MCRKRVARVSPYQVEAVGALELHVFEAIFANPEFRLLPVILGERGKIPGVDLKVADVDLVHVLHFRDLVGGRTYMTTYMTRWEGHPRFGDPPMDPWGHDQDLGDPPLEVWGPQSEVWGPQSELTASCSFSSAAVVGSISA